MGALRVSGQESHEQGRKSDRACEGMRSSDHWLVMGEHANGVGNPGIHCHLDVAIVVADEPGVAQINVQGGSRAQDHFGAGLAAGAGAHEVRAGLDRVEGCALLS